MTQVSFFELFFVPWVFPLHSLEGFRTRGEIDFSPCIEIFLRLFWKVLLMQLETLSPVPGHTIDSLGGTPATFMVQA